MVVYIPSVLYSLHRWKTISHNQGPYPIYFSQSDKHALRVSPDSDGGRHMDEVNEAIPNERGMIIKGTWQSIGILPIIAITHIATSLWAHPREYLR
ncbi:hypothetical protein Y032_0258g457 [Ancylostoma ceylanicum]|uniref:Uncharacterized protein n=1 Tax=Ancylostoma ceylanicum TaxID=53326 RepID=A0A016SBR4_9BILA|nr:hypothetical protein Y032_0258g457 [Ancylostoma ceylanicum]